MTEKIANNAPANDQGGPEMPHIQEQDHAQATAASVQAPRGQSLTLEQIRASGLDPSVYGYAAGD